MSKSDRKPEISVIIATYNASRALSMCLLGLKQQTFKNFEIIVADDGSTEDIQGLVSQSKFDSLDLRRIYHDDKGYRRNLIVNKAICSAKADYIVFIDADIIARPDYLANHIKLRKKGFWLSANRINIPESVHRELTEEDVISGRMFEYEWLVKRYPEIQKLRYRVACPPKLESLFNFLTHRPAAFMGANSSAWKSDLLRVNGFDTGFVFHGSEDRDLGVRMHNAGVRNRWLKFSLICMHLGHGKPYRDPVKAGENRKIMKQRIKNKTTWVDSGISAIDFPDCAALNLKKPA